MSALALTRPGYEAPAVAWQRETAMELSWVAWVVWVFTFSAALAWATYCIHQGGDPDIDVGWFRVKVSCNR